MHWVRSGERDLLDTELAEVAVEPSSGDGGVCVVVSDRGLGEYASEDGADDTREGVTGKDVEGVVNAHNVLEPSGGVGDTAGSDADEDGSGKTDESSCIETMKSAR